jgi:hypothetical protein
MREIPRKLPSSLLLAALLAGCGQKAAKDCPADEQAGCVDSTITYDAGIADILNARCQPCHAAGGVEATVPLTDYKKVSVERMSIGNQLVTCTMPPDGSPQLTSVERTQILNWLSCGAPE